MSKPTSNDQLNKLVQESSIPKANPSISPWDMKADAAVFAALFHAPGIEENGRTVPGWYNMYKVREAQDELIDQAFDAEDFDEISDLCETALSDPHLPALYRAKYEVYIALCSDQGRDLVLHVQRAEQMFERVQGFIDAGDSSEYTIALLKLLRKLAARIMDDLTDADIPLGTSDDEAIEEDNDDKGDEEETGKAVVVTGQEAVEENMSEDLEEDEDDEEIEAVEIGTADPAPNRSVHGLSTLSARSQNQSSSQNQSRARDHRRTTSGRRRVTPDYSLLEPSLPTLPRSRKHRRRRVQPSRRARGPTMTPTVAEAGASETGKRPAHSSTGC